MEQWLLGLSFAAIALSTLSALGFSFGFGSTDSAWVGAIHKTCVVVAVAGLCLILAMICVGLSQVGLPSVFQEKPIATFFSLLVAIIVCNAISDMWPGGSMSLEEMAPIFLLAAAAVYVALLKGRL